MIELLVAVTVFVVVIAIASGIFVQSLRTQRSLVALMAANDNAGLTLEQMAREMRTGRGFSVSGHAEQLDFTAISGEAVRYELKNGAILRNGDPLTGGAVRVAYLLFNLRGEALEDGLSTRVTVNVGVGAKTRQLREFITDLQTTVAVRLLDA